MRTAWMGKNEGLVIKWNVKGEVDRCMHWKHAVVNSEAILCGGKTSLVLYYCLK